MRSMTGYGRASADIAGRTVNVQVSSVNRKTLDLTVKLPEVMKSGGIPPQVTALQFPIIQAICRKELYEQF